MKRFDITDYLLDFVGDNEIEEDTEITIELEGKDICKALVKVDDGSVYFKVKRL